MKFLKYYLNSHNILQNSYNKIFLLFISLYLIISPHCPMRIKSMRKWGFLKYYLISHYILQNSHNTFFLLFVSLYSFHPTAKKRVNAMGKWGFLKYYLSSHYILQNSCNTCFLLFVSLYPFPHRLKRIMQWKNKVFFFSYYMFHCNHFTPPLKVDKGNGEMKFLKYYLSSHYTLKNSCNIFFLLFVSVYSFHVTAQRG